MDFYSAEPTSYRINFPFASSGVTVYLAPLDSLPPGGKLSSDILPLILIIFIPGGQAKLSRLVYLAPHPTQVQKKYMSFCYFPIIPTQCFYRFFGDFDWSVGKIKLFLHFDKNPCVGIFDNCLDFTVLDGVDNNELCRKLYNFYQIK